MYLATDTESNGLFDFSKPADAPGQPRLASIAMLVLDADLIITETHKIFIKPDGWVMSPEVTAINGLTTEFLEAKGGGFKFPKLSETMAFFKLVQEGPHTAIGDAEACRAIMVELKKANLLPAAEVHYAKDRPLPVSSTTNAPTATGGAV